MLMPKLRAGDEGGILHLTPVSLSSSETVEIPLRFIEIQGRPHILYAAEAPPAWISWATAARVRWRIGNQAFVGNASPVDDRSTLQQVVLPQYVRQFGVERASRWFGPHVGCLALSEATEEPSYYKQVEALFDQAARDYDRTVESDRLNLHLRRVSSEILRHLFPSGSRVLEIGCGTGLETIPLAKAGVNVLAVDLSAKMLAELDGKARAASIDDRVVTRKGSVGELRSIVSDLAPGSFDGAFSHFGALNCEPNLDGLPATLHRLVKANGRISLGVLNRTSLAEMVRFAAGMRPRRALARLHATLPVAQSQFGVLVFPHGPGQVRRLFWPFFAAEKAIGVSVLLPPAHLGRRLLRHPELLSLLEAVDHSVARRPLFRYLGDYFLMQMVRR